jgi:hypothetical protein
MKKPIIIAVVSVCTMVTARIVMGGLALLHGRVSLLAILLPIVVALLILIGIIKGHRLAWQWGRLVGLLGAIILTLSAYGAFVRIPVRPEMLIVAILMALQGIPLFPLFFALGTVAAKEHFRVICPSCGGSKVKGSDFLFTKVTCRNCNAQWS